MVKTILLILLLSTLSGCMSNRIVIVNNNCGIELYLSINKFRPTDSLTLLVKNNNNFQVGVGNFSCLANTHITLADSFDNRVAQQVKIKVDFSCREEFFQIGPGETKRFTYDFTIAELYNVIPNSRYKINLTYDGFVKINNRKNRCSNIVFKDWITFVE